MLRKKLPVEPVAAAIRTKRDHGVLRQHVQRDRSTRQGAVGAAAYGDLLHIRQGSASQLVRHVDGRCDEGQVRKAVFQLVNGGRSGAVEQLDVDAGVASPELGQHRKKENVQRNLRRRDPQNSAVQSAAAKQRFLPRLKLLKGRADVAVQRLPLGGQLHMAVVPKEQCAAQLPLQILDDPGDVGLTVPQGVRRLGKASGFGGIVENTVGLVADIHRFLHINLILRYKKYIFYISFHLDYNVPLVRSQSEIGGLSWNCG